MLLKHFVLRIKDTSFLLTVSLGLLPWLLVPFVFGRPGVTWAIAFILSHITGLGFLILLCFDFLDNRPLLRIAFAPGIGVIVESALLYLAVRFDFNSSLLYWSICAVGWMGAVLLIKSLGQRSQGMVGSRNLWYLILVSIIICLSYFVTDIRKNFVNTSENGYSFFNQDSTFNMAIAAAIKNGVKPWVPTLGESPLVYQYGSHGIAGSYARFTDTNLSDGLVALAGVGLISLLGAACGLAAIVARLYRGHAILGGIAGGVGVFFLLDVTTGLRMGFQTLVHLFGFNLSEGDFWRFTTGPAAHFHYSHS
ncbi:MAG: hypothetical protein L7F78_12955, partial [Syntrophales bacterium LBB04]|nr:hypothetical protein [Syntrophales bacterium LBB04]